MSEKRVKVYEMSDSGNWIDKGTGHVSIKYSTFYYLSVSSEIDGQSLLETKISNTDYSMLFILIIVNKTL